MVFFELDLLDGIGMIMDHTFSSTSRTKVSFSLTNLIPHLEFLSPHNPH